MQRAPPAVVKKGNTMNANRKKPSTVKPSTTDTFVAPLEQFGRDDLARAGGKGSNLGELARADQALKRLLAHPLLRR
jgi:hypothetical protein